MRLTKKILREMILLELPVTVSPKDSYNNRMVQYNNGGVDMSTQTVWNALQGLEDSIRTGQNADPEYLRRALDRLVLKLDACRKAAGETLKGIPVTASPKGSDNSQVIQYNNGGIDMLTQAAWNAFQGLETSIRMSQNADPEYLDAGLDRLALKIDACRNAARETLKGRVE